jgi:hypothetical protein
MSPALNPKFYQIKLRIYQGQDFPPMDKQVMGSNKIDAYLLCEFKGKKYKTNYIKMYDKNKNNKCSDP